MALAELTDGSGSESGDEKLAESLKSAAKLLADARSDADRAVALARAATDAAVAEGGLPSASADCEQPALHGWLIASLYDVFSVHTSAHEVLQTLTASCVPAGGSGGPTRAVPAAAAIAAEAALRQQLAVAAAVAPHSDLHVLLAVKAALRAAQGDAGEAAARAAWAAAGQAVRGRYGRALSDTAVRRLLAGAEGALAQVAL